MNRRPASNAKYWVIIAVLCSAVFVPERVVRAQAWGLPEMSKETQACVD